MIDNSIGSKISEGKVRKYRIEKVADVKSSSHYDSAARFPVMNTQRVAMFQAYCDTLLSVDVKLCGIDAPRFIYLLKGGIDNYCHTSMSWGLNFAY